MRTNPHTFTHSRIREQCTCNIIHTDNRIDDDNIDFHQTAEPVKRNMYLYLYLYLYGVREVLYIATGKAYTLPLTHCKRVDNTVESTRLTAFNNEYFYPLIHTHRPLENDMKYFSIKPSTRIFFSILRCSP